MLERVLLDANAALNATFVPSSWSRLVVTKLRRQHKAPFIGSRTLSEAISTARHIASAQGKRGDPAPIIDYFIRLFGAIEVPPAAECVVEEAIPAHDRQVVQEAVTANATILTSDAELWLACRSVGRSAIWPLEALRNLDGLSLGLTVFGERPASHAGSIFARVSLGAWAAGAGDGDHTIVDFSGRLWLYYSTNTRQWVAQVPELGTLRVGSSPPPNVKQTIAVTWDSDYLRLRVGGVQHPAEINIRKPLAGALLDAFSVGQRMDLTCGWNGGAIDVCVMNDRPIAEQWKFLRDSDELTPNPCDSDRLWAAIKGQLV